MKTRIVLSQLECSCLIGVLDEERVTPQRILVDLELEMDCQRAVADENLEATWDYDRLSDELLFLLETGHFYLLETAAHVLARWVLIPPIPGEERPQVDRVVVKLTKPAALPGHAQAIVEVEGLGSEQTYESEDKEWGQVDIVAETRRMGFYRLTIDSQKELPEHHHQKMRECELVLHPGLSISHEKGPYRTLRVGERFSWKAHELHAYRNTAHKSASLLCMDSPPFDPEDEILSEAS